MLCTIPERVRVLVQHFNFVQHSMVLLDLLVQTVQLYFVKRGMCVGYVRSTRRRAVGLYADPPSCTFLLLS